jgi:hypothetical protein
MCCLSQLGNYRISLVELILVHVLFISAGQDSDRKHEDLETRLRQAYGRSNVTMRLPREPGFVGHGRDVSNFLFLAVP